ncbi:MAG: hypothetical protein M1825_006400 [Sarcosagium campestre]|nr:MAG: hypothetical protein M1825_006400 [Sarcosagium campestre]
MSISSRRKIGTGTNWTFYPVRIGEVFQSRYQVLGKLGYGSRSTAWLCCDLRGHKYVTLKVRERDTPTIRRELAAYKHLNTISTRNPGVLLYMSLFGMSMETLRQLLPGRKLPESLLKAFLPHLLHALDFLHTDAKMIHADLQAFNVHLKIEEDETILQEFEAGELSSPGPRKIDGDRIIYESRGLKWPKDPGRPVLCDFGEARFGEKTCTDEIQPHVYRAPEVILGISWTYSADIWNVGVMIWDIFENKHLFNTHDGNDKYSSLQHMAGMVAVLGLPPLDYLRRYETSREYFDDTGAWKGAVEIPNLSLEDSERAAER